MHTFQGKVHTLNEANAFVLFNHGDNFAANIWPSPSQLAELAVGDEIVVKGNLVSRRHKTDPDKRNVSVSVPKGSWPKLAVYRDEEWHDLEPDEEEGATASAPTTLPDWAKDD